MGLHTPPHRRSAARSSDEIRRALDAIRRIVRAVRLASQGTRRERGLSGAQYVVLQQLAGAPAESVNELAQRTWTHQSSVSVVVSRLVDLGLVHRRTSPEDARKSTIELTGKGALLVRDAEPTVQERLIGALQRMPATQRTVLVDALDLWMHEAGLDQEPAELFFEGTGGEVRAGA